MIVLDWDKNIDINFKQNRFMRPKVCALDDKHKEEWICYKCEVASAKRLTVFPGQTVVIKDPCAYGAILIAGRGKFGKWTAETPTLIRYGELTCDEFFISEDAAKKGVTITNESQTENLVILKHFAKNPDLDI